MADTEFTRRCPVCKNFVVHVANTAELLEHVALRHPREYTKIGPEKLLKHSVIGEAAETQNVSRGSRIMFWAIIGFVAYLVYYWLSSI